MFRFVLKLSEHLFGAFMVNTGFFKNIRCLKLVARIKKIFVNQKENSKGGDTDKGCKFQTV